MNLSGGDWTEEDQQRYEERQKIKDVENNVKEMWRMEVRKVLALEKIAEELSRFKSDEWGTVRFQ
jgi:pyruvoyl-dependent arginine decarboxylase (PvlArgDC)|tara:strand:+ start:151 stop:345 length:195 start_codon:yes stop_codon:yes gene_type:complete